MISSMTRTTILVQIYRIRTWEEAEGVKVFSTRPKINSSFLLPLLRNFSLENNVFTTGAVAADQTDYRIRFLLLRPTTNPLHYLRILRRTKTVIISLSRSLPLFCTLSLPSSVLSCLDAYSALLASLIAMRYFSTFVVLPH